jgi:hypothetical protein
VAWPSSIFDLTATTFTLIAILTARAYVRTPTTTLRIATLGFIVAGILCKETAVVAPILVLLDAWARGRVNRTQVIDCSGIAVAGVLYGAFRVSTAGAHGLAPSRYLVQRYVFETFGGLALPWHARIVTAEPYLAMAGATIVLAIFVLGFVARTTPPRLLRRLAAMALWLFVCTLPVLPFMYVSPDMEGARYLYMSGVGWSVGISYLAVNLSSPRGFATLSGVALASLLVVIYLIGVRYDQAPWLEAAALRDKVLDSAQHARLQPCESFVFVNPPDSVSGAFVFRNGFEFAVQGRKEDSKSVDGAAPCEYRWDPTINQFVSLKRP